MTLHIPSLPLQVYLACPPALDVNPTMIDMDAELWNEMAAKLSDCFP